MEWSYAVEKQQKKSRLDKDLNLDKNQYKRHNLIFSIWEADSTPMSYNWGNKNFILANFPFPEQMQEAYFKNLFFLNVGDGSNSFHSDNSMFLGLFQR